MNLGCNQPVIVERHNCIAFRAVQDPRHVLMQPKHLGCVDCVQMNACGRCTCCIAPVVFFSGAVMIQPQMPVLLLIFSADTLGRNLLSTIDQSTRLLLQFATVDRA